MAGSVKIAGLAIAALLMLLVLGGLTGWLVGGSREPAVAALLPVLLGVLGIVGLARLPRMFAEPLPDRQRGKDPSAADKHVDTRVIVQLATVMCFGVVIYCAALFVGAKEGISDRVADRGQLPSIDALVPARTHLTDSQYLALLRLRMALARTDATETEVREVFRRALNPIHDQLADVVREQVDPRLWPPPLEPSGAPTVLAPLSALVPADDLADEALRTQLERMRLHLERTAADPAHARTEITELLATARAERINPLRYIERTTRGIEVSLDAIGSGYVRPSSTACVPCPQPVAPVR